MLMRNTFSRVDQGLAQAFAALVLGSVAMGASPIFVRFASSDIGPFASAFWRVLIALPILYLWMRLDEAKRGKSPAVQPFGKFSVYAGLAFTGDLFFWHLSILNTTVANATFFATMTPVFIILITWFIFRQKVALASIAGLIFCLCGGMALIWQTLQVDPSHLRGDFFGICTAFFFSLYFLSVGKARQSGGAARITFELTVVTASALFVIAILDSFISGTRIIPHTQTGVAAICAMALICHVGGQGLLALSLGRLPPVFSSLVIFLEAIAAALFGWIFLNESLSALQLFGGALILIGIWVARPRKSSQK